MRINSWLGILVVVCILGGPAMGWSEGKEKVHVAVASNFLNPLKEIAKRYKQDTGNALILISGSTGKLYAQVLHGAPFDVLLAADAKRPALLEKKGVGIAGTRFTYAIGALVLWSHDPEKVQGMETLTKMNMGKLAIANPRTAPYGKAAQEILEQLDLWKKLQPFLVRGENIAQTMQFVATENAGLGLVAQSQVKDPRFKLKGSQWQVPLSMHNPIYQQAVLLKPGRNNSAAKKFLEYLSGPNAKNIIQAYGYHFVEDK